jgi:hypothetical protein
MLLTKDLGHINTRLLPVNHTYITTIHLLCCCNRSCIHADRIIDLVDASQLHTSSDLHLGGSASHEVLISQKAMERFKDGDTLDLLLK